MFELKQLWMDVFNWAVAHQENIEHLTFDQEVSMCETQIKWTTSIFIKQLFDTFARNTKKTNINLQYCTHIILLAKFLFNIFVHAKLPFDPNELKLHHKMPPHDVNW